MKIIDPERAKLPPHEWDDDACCIHCGFDGAEWWWINRHTPPGERELQPRCKPRDGYVPYNSGE